MPRNYCQYVLWAEEMESELNTGLAVLGGAILSKDVVIKILGPTADYIGDELRGWTERRVNNVGRIFQSAREKLGDRIEENGAVSPRILAHILNQGSYCDEKIFIDYFGGVLASSRSGVIRDDRGIYWAALASRLSVFQLRAHYLIYTAISSKFAGRSKEFPGYDRKDLAIFIPSTAYYSGMSFSEQEIKQDEAISVHSIFGLQSMGLIESNVWTSRSSLREKVDQAICPGEEEGLFVVPSAPGVELFLWAHGDGQLCLNAIFEKTFPRFSEIAVCWPVFTIDELKANNN